MDQNKGSGSDGKDGYNAMLDVNADSRVDSARIVLGPLFQQFSPSSVLDVGCGHGVWLQVCRELGADVIQGVDGPWIDTDALAIPAAHFMAQALETPLTLGKKFDLVISLEVAEHLPEAAADTFVDSLVQHGDVILFSAAVPFQGAKSHLNEQWQAYWGHKFSDRGFSAIDLVRPMLWDNESVLWWLRQNAILYVRSSTLNRWPELQDQEVKSLDRLSVVHPALYLRWVSMAGDLALKLEKKTGG